MRTAYLNTFQIDLTFNHCGSAASIPGQSMRDLWWTKQVFLRVPRTVSVIPQISTLIFIYVSLLAEGQTVEGWEPSKKQYFFGYWGALDIKLRIFT
jgi:hypothetical protein